MIRQEDITQASIDVSNIGNFAEGSVTEFSKNNIDALNDTLTFVVTNPTTATQNVNLFGFTNSLFISPAAVNPPPSILPPILAPTGVTPTFGVFCPPINTFYIINTGSNDLTCGAPFFVPFSVPLPPATNPNVIAYCPINNFIYVGGGNSIVIIDCATNLVVNIIPLLGGATGMAYNSIKNTIYFQEVGGNLQEIDCITNTIVASILSPPFPSDMEFCPTFNRLYQITNNDIIPFDCVTNTYGVVIIIGAGSPQKIQFCSTNNNVYITDGVANAVIPVNCITNIVGVPIVTASPTIGIAYNSINNIIYVGQPALNNFIEINPTNNTIINTVVGLGGLGLAGIIYQSNQNQVILIESGTNDFMEYLPISPPTAVISLQGGITMAELFNDLQAKPFLIRGLKMFVQNINQFFNNLLIQTSTITGQLDSFNFQPNNYVSPTNPQSLIIDATDLVMTIFYKAQITFNINPSSTIILAFSISRSVDNTTLFSQKTEKVEDRENIRITGNPIFDMIQIELVKNGSLNVKEEDSK